MSSKNLFEVDNYFGLYTHQSLNIKVLEPYPASADRAYYDKDFIEKLERKYKVALAIPHKKRKGLGMSRKKKPLYRKRSAIEAKISEGKRLTGLGKLYYKGFAGDKMWVSLSVLALNLRQLLKDLAKKPELIYRFG
jgi:hypothetical protein